MTDDLYAGIDEAKKIAKRLVQRGRAVEEAIRRRDNTLYKLLAHLHRLDRRLRKHDWNEVSKALVAKYGGKSPVKSKLASFLLQLAHPSLNNKTRSKYAMVITYARKHKKTGSFKTFVKQNGGLNGCVAEAATLRRSSRKKPTNAGKNQSTSFASKR